MALVEGTNCGFVTIAPVNDPLGSGTALDNFTRAARFTSPAGAVRVTEIGWWCDTASEAANFEVGIYDNDGSPNNLLDGESRINAKGTDAGWKKASGLNITISENTVYWLAAQLDDVTTLTYTNYQNDAGYSLQYVTPSATLPDPWDGGSAAGRMMAIYAVYETGGTGVLTDPGMTGGMDDLDGGIS